MAVATKVIFPNPRSDLLSYVEALSGQRVMRCFQCGKCTAGCPLAFAMDITPRQVMRCLQLGLIDEVLQSESIRLCVSCYTCAVRCPAEIDIPAVMEALVQRADRLRLYPKQGEIPLFQRLFLRLMERTGRTYELGLAGLYNLLSGHPFANISILPDLLRKRKLPLIPETSGQRDIQRIINRVAEHEDGSMIGMEAARRQVGSKQSHRALGAALLALGAGTAGAYFILNRRGRK